MKRTYLFFLITILLGISTNAQNKPEYNIGFLLDKNTVEIEALLNNLEEEITAVVGEDAVINFSNTKRLVNDFDLVLAEQNYNTFLSSEVDIIIAFGVINNKIISKKKSFDKPTILFGSTSQELIETVKLDKSSKIENFTTIISNQSYTNDLEKFQEIANIKNVGVFFETEFIENKAVQNVFIEIENALGIQLTLKPFDNLSDIIKNLEGFDSVYLAGGFYLLDDEIKQLADTLIEKKIPSFTATTVKDVKSGLLASNHHSSELNQFFRHIALTVETVVLGGNLSDLSVELDVDRELTINYNTAEKIGLPLKYSLIATTNIIGNPALRSADKKYNLFDVMQEAIAKNLNLENFRKDVLLSEEETRLAKSNYLPNLSIGANGSYVDPELAAASAGQNPEILTSANVALSQTVFSNAANASISIQKALQKAQQENYYSEELNTVFQASSAYFDALIIKANLSIQSRNLDLTKYNLKIANENFEAGLAGKSDVLRFRSEMAKNTQDLIKAGNNMNQALYNLNQVLNNPIDTKIDVEEAELEVGVFKTYNYQQLGAFIDDPSMKKPFVDFLVEEAIKNAPELKALDYNLQAAERSERLYGGGRFLPTLALKGQYYYELSRSGVGTEFPPLFPVRPGDYYSVGLNLSIPVFDQNRQNINKAIATIQKDQINVTQDNIKLIVQKNINDAVLELINQISNIHLSKISEETAEEALDLTQTSYASGAVNIVQLLDAQNNYLEAQQARTTATYSYLLSSMQLERYLGNFFLLQTEEERQEFVNRFLEYLSINN
jgi:outer membrane protein TolC